MNLTQTISRKLEACVDAGVNLRGVSSLEVTKG
jgi:hypothetical protein